MNTNNRSKIDVDFVLIKDRWSISLSFFVSLVLHKPKKYILTSSSIYYQKGKDIHIIQMQQQQTKNSYSYLQLFLWRVGSRRRTIELYWNGNNINRLIDERCGGESGNCRSL